MNRRPVLLTPVFDVADPLTPEQRANYAEQARAAGLIIRANAIAYGCLTPREAYRETRLLGDHGA